LKNNSQINTKLLIVYTVSMTNASGRVPVW